MLLANEQFFLIAVQLEEKENDGFFIEELNARGRKRGEGGVGTEGEREKDKEGKCLLAASTPDLSCDSRSFTLDESVGKESRVPPMN